MKSSVSEPLSAVACLFATPVPYSKKEPFKTIFVNTMRDFDGTIVTCHECIEDESSNISALDFSSVTLSNLIANGVEPHSLDLIEVSKLGIDRSIDSIAESIIRNSDKFVVKPSNDN